MKGNMTEYYEYKRLSQHNEIRLLNLHPALHFDDPVLVDIEHQRIPLDRTAVVQDTETRFRKALYKVRNAYRPWKESWPNHGDLWGGKRWRTIRYTDELAQDLHRLVQPHFKTIQEKLQCKWEKLSCRRERDPSYEAVSYAWGSGVPARSCSVQDRVPGCS
jgi:hypothetical protein